MNVLDPIKTMEDLVRRITRLNECPRILIVEDDENYARLIKAWFEELPFHLEFAFNGEDAIERLSTQEFNLVWLDLKLPGISGVEVLRCIKDVPTIVVTGYPNEDFAKEALELNKAVLLYGKPNNLQELRRFLSTFKLNNE